MAIPRDWEVPTICLGCKCSFIPKRKGITYHSKECAREFNSRTVKPRQKLRHKCGFKVKLWALGDIP